MVRAILDGRKTQTRRPVKVQWCNSADALMRQSQFDPAYKCHFGVPGDRLWVRETTCIAPKRFANPDDTCVTDCDGDKRYVSYKADGHSEDAMRDYKLKWTPSIHMPRWASRITLEITNVRVERLQEITEDDARDEGWHPADGQGPVEWFEDLWNSINGPGSWDLNPYVWVIGFRRVQP